jgi:hypothetical protein
MRDRKVQEWGTTFVQGQGMANETNVIASANHEGGRLRVDADSSNGIPEESHCLLQDSDKKEKRKEAHQIPRK